MGVDAPAETRSNIGFVAGGAEGGGEVIGGDVALNKLIISVVADCRGAVEGAEGVASEPLEPKISASRSWVDGPLTAAPPLGMVGVEDSSPIRSTTVSLSVRVEPTGFLSLTVGY